METKLLLPLKLKAAYYIFSFYEQGGENLCSFWVRWLSWWKLMSGSPDVLIFFSEARFHFHLMKERCYPLNGFLYVWKQMCRCNGIACSSLMYYLPLSVFIYTQLLHKLSCHFNGWGLICCHAGLGEWKRLTFYQLWLWSLRATVTV